MQSAGIGAATAGHPAEREGLFSRSAPKKKPGLPGFFSNPLCLANYAGRIFDAWSPLGPVVLSKLTFWPSLRDLKPASWIAEKWANRSVSTRPRGPKATRRRI